MRKGFNGLSGLVREHISHDASWASTLGRKNYLFTGSHPGAQRAAMMYCFFASCKYAKVNPWEWLTDILGMIGPHSINRLEELLPAQ